MSFELLKRSFLIWLGLFVLGFVNGTIREAGIKRWISEPWAHHLSALTALMIFGIYVASIWRKSLIGTVSDAVAVGVFWFLMTVLTETFVLNRWMSKMSWEQILQSYNIARGQLWPLVLLWVGLLPVLMRSWKGPAL